MTEITVQFSFPGEGMNIDGTEITPDTPIDPDQLEYIYGTPHYRKRLERGLRAPDGLPSPGVRPDAIRGP